MMVVTFYAMVNTEVIYLFSEEILMLKFYQYTFKLCILSVLLLKDFMFSYYPKGEWKGLKF